jgi:hypothetical protein
MITREKETERKRGGWASEIMREREKEREAD